MPSLKRAAHPLLESESRSRPLAQRRTTLKSYPASECPTGVAEASKKLSQATSSRCPTRRPSLGVDPSSSPDQLATLRSPSGSQLPGAPSSQHTLSCILLSPTACQDGPLSADPRPLLAFLLYFGFSASLPWVLGHLGLWFPGKSSHPLRMNIYLILPKEYKISLLSPYIPIPPPPAAPQETGSTRWGRRREMPM